MSTQDLVAKLWNLCNLLRDDGVAYHRRKGAGGIIYASLNNTDGRVITSMHGAVRVI